MHAVDVRVENLAPRPTRRLAFSLVFGEIPPLYTLAEPWDQIPLSRVIRAPSVERLPTGFAFDGDEPRRLLGRDLVTFVADPIELEGEVDPVIGYPVEPKSRVLRSSPIQTSLEKGLPWTIPVHRYDSPPTQAASSSTTPSPSGKTKPKGRKSSPTEDM